MNLQDQYVKETGKAAYQPGGVPEVGYVEWLENKLIDIRKTIFYGTKALSDVTNDMQDTIKELSEDE